MRSRRALLYMPGDDPHKIQKAAALGVDCVCMDLEDGVATNHKDMARAAIADALQNMTFGKSERLVRINSIHSGMAEADLDAVLPNRPDGIVLPKVFSPEQMLRVSWLMAEVESYKGWPVNSMKLVVIVETAQAILNLEDICGASVPRLEAVIFGAEDLAADMGAIRTRPAWEIFYARSAVVLHAAAYGLQAIDMVSNDFHNLDFVRQEARQGVEMGFSGKQVIHPAQVPVVQEQFTPDDKAIEDALRTLEAFEKHQTEGRGAFAVNGGLVDMPIIKQMQNILERARAAGKL